MQSKRVEFWQKVRDIPAKELIFIDESGVNLAMMRMYARAIVGQRARGSKPQKRGRNVSILGALSLEKAIASQNIYGAVDAVTFEAFIANKLVPNLWVGACVIMDNAKIHLGEEIRKLIEAAGAKLIYLSPYSPEFNPIENFWSKVKASLKKIKPRSYLDLINAIASLMARDSSEHRLSLHISNLDKPEFYLAKDSFGVVWFMFLLYVLKVVSC